LIIQGYTSAIAGRDGGNVVIASGQKTGTGEITDGSVTITSKSGVNIGTPGEPTDLYAQGNIFVPHGYVKIGQWTFQQVADASPPPDYVFAKEYELRGLDSVESFIQQNKHLPDVPSAKEFQEKGGNIVEMNYTLLRKIEELTLYVIEQNKQIEKLQAAVSK
jgi:hypothetical protein